MTLGVTPLFVYAKPDYTHADKIRTERVDGITVVAFSKKFIHR